MEERQEILWAYLHGSFLPYRAISMRVHSAKYLLIVAAEADAMSAGHRAGGGTRR